MKNNGVLYAVAAYILWGLLPIYWKLLSDVPSLQILFHRIVWALFFLVALLLYKGRLRSLAAAWRDRRILLVYALAALFLGVNWGVYIWGVNAGYILETSLGYFINPLVSVLFGMVFLKESLRPGQWLAIILAAGGVIYLTISYGQLPWIALTLAFSFGIYGLMKKKAPMDSIQGLTLETAVLFLPALGLLLYFHANGSGGFGSISRWNDLLLMASGVVTAVPLLLFGAAAARIPLSLVGILQYIAPTLQFLIGVLIYGEDFSRARLIGFSIIWVALAIYTIENIMTRQRTLSYRAMAD